MRVITLWQPWAALIAEGHKTIETRSWMTNYRGPLLIHAAARVPDLRDLEVFDRELTGVSLHLRAIIAICDLVDVQPTDTLPIDPYGDFTPGRYGWILRNVRKLSPVSCKGALGLWELPAELMEPIRVQCRP